MPTIFVNGPLTKGIDQRRAVVEGITDVIAKTYDMPKDAITVVIREDAGDHVGNGGVLLCEK